MLTTHQLCWSGAITILQQLCMRLPDNAGALHFGRIVWPGKHIFCDGKKAWQHELPAALLAAVIAAVEGATI